MCTLRLIFTCLLSLAILSVESAAIAMSVHSPCAMMQVHAASPDMAMTSSGLETQQSMPQMDCMKVEKTLSNHVKHCDTGQDCVMYHVPLAHSASNIVVLHSKQPYQDTQCYSTYSSEFIPTPDLFGLWRPPRTL